MKISIIGFGHLGHALAEGLLVSGTCASDLTVCGRHAEALSRDAAQYGVCATTDVNEALSRSDVSFLTVKAAVLEELAPSISGSVICGKTVVSFMAGMTLGRLRELLPGAEVIRAMPSVAIAKCSGVIGYTKSPPEVEELFHRLGYAFEAEPDDIEKVMAFAACGLGFAAYLVGAFVSAGENMGFSRENSERIAVKTFENALELGSFDETVRAVATKGGATEQGVLHMDDCRVKAAIVRAVEKAYEKMK